MKRMTIKLNLEISKTDGMIERKEIEVMRRKATEAFEVLKKPGSRVLYDHLGVVPSDCEDCLGYKEWFLFVYMEREFGSLILMLVYCVIITSSSTGICGVLQPLIFILAVVVQTYLVLPHLWGHIVTEDYGYLAGFDLLPFQVKGLVTLIYFLIAVCFLVLNKACRCKFCSRVDTNREMALEVERVLLERNESVLEQKKNQ